MENTEFVDLYNKGILVIASEKKRSFVFGTFIAVRIYSAIKKNIFTPELLQLPKTEFTQQEIKKIKSERPLFVSQINSVNNLLSRFTRFLTCCF